MQPKYDEIDVGYELQTLEVPPITRTTLALFAGASGDHNPIHIDIDVAKKAGMSDVFAQGMLPMAYLGRLLTNWTKQENIREYSTRFSAITHLGNVITCSGVVVKKFEENGQKLAQLDIQAKDENGEVKLSGSALVVLD